jgi:hypothetical protein
MSRTGLFLGLPVILWWMPTHVVCVRNKLLLEYLLCCIDSDGYSQRLNGYNVMKLPKFTKLLCLCFQVIVRTFRVHTVFMFCEIIRVSFNGFNGQRVDQWKRYLVVTHVKIYSVKLSTGIPLVKSQLPENHSFLYSRVIFQSIHVQSEILAFFNGKSILR